VDVAARHPEAAVIVPPRSSAVPSETAETAPTPRDRHLQAIAEHGRMGWQKASGYNWRALVEADIGRWKRVIGHALRSQTEKRQATEVALAVDVRNRMLALGRPSYVRIVSDHEDPGSLRPPADPCNKVTLTPIPHCKSYNVGRRTLLSRSQQLRALRYVRSKGCRSGY